jgi:dihydrofolate synthase/folylpolyglutamate synthase
VIREACANRRAGLITVEKDVAWEKTGSSLSGQSLKVTGRRATYDITIPLLGAHQLQNAATAVAALEALGVRKTAIEAGLARTRWAGRLQILRRRPLMVVDGAHTAESARALKTALDQYFHFDRLVLIIGASADKDMAGIVAEFVPLAHRVIATRSRHPRAADTEAVAREFARRGAAVEVADGVSEAVTRARGTAGSGDLICATGSLFLVAEVIEHMKGLRPELYPNSGRGETGDAG